MNRRIFVSILAIILVITMVLSLVLTMIPVSAEGLNETAAAAMRLVS